MGNHGHAENTGFPDGDSLVLSVGGPAGIHADKTEKNGNGCFNAEVDPSKSSDNNDTATDLQSGTRDLENTSTESENQTKESFLSMLYYFIHRLNSLHPYYFIHRLHELRRKQREMRNYTIQHFL